MTIDPRLLILALIGVVAGFINVVAGGGSLLTLPALIFSGLPAATANGTNRIALVGQNLTAMLTFRRKGFDDLSLGLKLGSTAIIGAVIGARIAIATDDLLFRRILSGVMILVIIGMLFKRPPGDDNADETLLLKHFTLQLLIFFGVGIYGGFIQAGVGYLVMFALSVVGGLSLVRTNSLKVIIVGLYMLPSLVVFVVEGKVAWIPGLALTVGNSLGGWLGSTFSVGKGDRWIRVVLVLVVLGMAGRLAGLY